MIIMLSQLLNVAVVIVGVELGKKKNIIIEIGKYQRKLEISLTKKNIREKGKKIIEK